MPHMRAADEPVRSYSLPLVSGSRKKISIRIQVFPNQALTFGRKR